MKKFLCLFVMALLVFALSGCGGSSHDDFPLIDVTPDPTSQDVTPETPQAPDITPTSPDVTPVVPDLPASPDIQPVPMPTPTTSQDVPTPPTPPSTTSPDVTPTTPTTPTSPDTPATPTTDSPDVTPTTPTTDSPDVTGETYTSTEAMTNAIVADGTTETYTNITVTKYGDATGSSDGTGGYDWTGTNAAILAKGGANLTISGSGTTITTNAKGANAVFSYGGSNSTRSGNTGDGTTITISDATITTTGNNSGGIMTTGGGVMNASNLTIITSGGSSAAIRSDSGGGTVTVSGGSYTTSGVGSPAIYSTAEISVYGADLTSNVSQVVVIEGGNSVTLTDSTLNANHNQLNGQDTYHQAVLIYKSMSMDASGGASFFTMTGGSITNAQGDIFHVTNTTTTINLSESVAITNNDSSGYFLRASSGKWGNSGSNGGKVTLNADGQTINGNMIIDSVSTLTLNMSNSSEFNGAINSSGQNGTVSVVLDSSSVWTLTGDSYVTSLTNNGTINQGSHTLYVNGTAYTNN